MGRRITRKQLKQQDEFVTIADTVFHWLSGNWRPIVLAAGAAVFVYLVWGLSTFWSDSRAQEASAQLVEAVKVLDGDPTEEGAADEATPSESGEPGDSASAEELLNEVIDQHGGTTQGDIARLYVARLQLERGETEQARTSLARLADKHRGNLVGRLAAYDLIHLRIASGQSDEVTTELQARATGQDNRLPRDVALWELAVLHEKEQKVDEAREYFQTIVDEFPDSSYQMAASRKLTELG